MFGRSDDLETATACVQGRTVLSEPFGTARPIAARGLIGYRRAFGDVVPRALLERPSPKWPPVRHKRARREKGSEPYPIATRSGTAPAFGGGGQASLTAGVPVARDAVVASAGLDVQVARTLTVGLNYTGRVGSQAQDHAVTGSFSYR